MSDTEHLLAHDDECLCTTCLLALQLDDAALNREARRRVRDRDHFGEEFSRALTYDWEERRR